MSLRRTSPYSWILILTVGLGVLVVPVASARADEAAVADALFQQAKVLTEQQRFGDACPKFAASFKLDPTAGTLMNLADCEEHLGKLATAWAHWGEAVELLKKNADKRVEFAQKHRDALTKRLPMVQLDVVSGPTTLEVFRDGVKIDSAGYGVPLPTDPGTHQFEVRRGGTEVLAGKSVDTKEATTVNLAFDLPAIQKAAPPPKAASSVQRRAGYWITGVGVATVMAAGGLEIAALVNKGYAGAADACIGKLCTPTGIAAIGQAKNLANAGQWVGIAGILVSAVGLTTVFTAPSDAGPQVTASPWVTPTGAGIMAGGRF